MSAEKPWYTPEKALEFLKMGNQRRLQQIQKTLESPTVGQQYKNQRAKLTESQHPFAVLVGCSDSRFPPEVIFSNREGDIFVVRTAGHVIENDAAGSIEYAVEHLKVPLIVVMGHDRCGAVTTALQHAEVHGHIFNLIEHIYPAVNKSKDMPGDPLQNAINQHILNTVKHLKKLEPICKKYYEEGRLNIMGARCNIETYGIEWL